MRPTLFIILLVGESFQNYNSQEIQYVKSVSVDQPNKLTIGLNAACYLGFLIKQTQTI